MPRRDRVQSLEIVHVCIACSTEYKAWVKRLADEVRRDSTGVIDYALCRLAAERGFEPPPKRSEWR